MTVEILKLKISDLKLLENNPRTIGKDKFEKLCKDMLKDPDFLERRPVLIDKVNSDLIVYAGNQRVRAAKKLGWKEIPCIVDENLSETVKKKRIIADNLHAGEWDYDILANEWELSTLLEAGFDAENLIGEVCDLDSEEKLAKDKKTKSCPHCGAELGR